MKKTKKGKKGKKAIKKEKKQNIPKPENINQDAPKRKPGRPKAENREEIIKEICAKISQSNKSLYTCLEELRKDNEQVPNIRKVYEWLDADETLRHLYARAKEEQADYLVEEMLAIADDDSDDAIFVESTDASGKTARRVCNNEFVQRSRLRVDTRKWIAAKLKPKKYGEKLEIETPDGSPLVVIRSAAKKKIKH